MEGTGPPPAVDRQRLAVDPVIADRRQLMMVGR